MEFIVIIASLGEEAPDEIRIVARDRQMANLLGADGLLGFANQSNPAWTSTPHDINMHPADGVGTVQEQAHRAGPNIAALLDSEA